MKNLKQKVLVGTLVASTAAILVGTILVFPPVIIAGGVGVGLSLRKRLFFKKKKKKQPKQPKSKKLSIRERFFKKKQPQSHVIQDVSLLEPGLRGQAPIGQLQIMDY